MNSIHLVGNVGQNPSLRETNGGTSVANVTLATNRFYRDRDGERQQATEWHRLVVWGEGAKNFAQIVGKGDQIAVRGRLEYKLREIAGEKVKDATIRVEEWTKLSPRKADAPAEEAGPAAAACEGDEAGESFQGEGIPFGSGESDIPFGGSEPEAPTGEGQHESAPVAGEGLPATPDLQPIEPAAADPVEPTAAAPTNDLSAEPEPTATGDAPARRGRRRKQ